jgi:hypothetical protein
LIKVDCAAKLQQKDAGEKRSMHEVQKLNHELFCGFYGFFFRDKQTAKNKLLLAMFELK